MHQRGPPGCEKEYENDEDDEDDEDNDDEDYAVYYQMIMARDNAVSDTILVSLHIK